MGVTASHIADNLENRARDKYGYNRNFALNWCYGHRRAVLKCVEAVFKLPVMRKIRLAEMGPEKPLNVPSSVRQVLAQIYDNPPDSLYNYTGARTRLVFKEAGAEETKVTTGGYGLMVQHMTGVLISIVPVSKSARPEFGEDGLTLWPWLVARRAHGFSTWNGLPYTVPNRGSARMIEALRIAADGFTNADGDIERFYKALGARGSCAMCGRTLTDELSMARGIGPECITYISAPWAVAALDEERRKKARQNPAYQVPESDITPGGEWPIVRGIRVRLEAVNHEKDVATLRAMFPQEDGTFHAGSRYTMPVGSVSQHISDMQHDVPPFTTPSGNTVVDAVQKGKGTFLDKGNDGLVFQCGAFVVKMSTTTPYIPENPGHRQVAQAIAHGAREAQAHHELAGIPHIQCVTGLQHANRYWMVKPLLQVLDMRKEGALTLAECKSLARTMEKMHARGWALCDTIQAGRGADGEVYLMDLGQAVKDAKYFDYDNESMGRLFSDQGFRMLPEGEALRKAELKLREGMIEALRKPSALLVKVRYPKWKAHADEVKHELLVHADDITAWNDFLDVVDPIAEAAEQVIAKAGVVHV